MKRIIATSVVMLTFAVTACDPSSSKTPVLLPGFPDFGHMIDPAKYQGRVFKLSQDFPSTQPGLEPAVKTILDIDFKQDWRQYIMAVRDYILEGNTGNADINQDFFLEDNKVRRWYHVPWQHFGPNGREGLHGLTKEGPIAPRMLTPQQTQMRQTYAVGFYNAPGGYTIGRVWKDPHNPDVDYMKAHGFPVGTVVGKILFTTATVNEVAYLKNPVQWQAYVTKSFQSQEREVQSVRLIQMDIMVRDPRADSTGGWVFGTFVYNGAKGEKDLWRNLVPVGLMWGNDPTVKDDISNPTPIKTMINPNIKESVINPEPELPPMHLGWGMRLNGPVDNPRSSCMSCHATAQYPAISGITPFFNEPPYNTPGSPEWMRWFRNVPCATPFDPQATSMDYSLQLSQSVQHFVAWKAQNIGGLYNVQYWSNGEVQPVLRNRVE